MKVYGIKNCNTMKKTFDFLQKMNVSFEFVDYKKQVPNEDLIKKFLGKTSLDSLVNRQGTTFKKLDDEQKLALLKDSSAISLLCEYPSMIKRPLIEYADGSITLGFVPEQIQEKF